jgi:DNA-binding XRE family transcriptional regulator
MPDLAAVMKTEIRRLAKREAKALAAPLQKAVAQLRRQVWALGREARQLRRQVAELKASPAPTALPVVEPKGITRLGPYRIRALRRRLGLSLVAFAKLVGASAKSVVNWEHGKTKPNAKMRAKIIAARTLNKTAARKLVGKR